MSRMLFRVDANKTIGRGHLSRTLAVAEMFKDGYEVSFLISAAYREYCAPLLTQWNALYITDDNHLISLLQQNDILWIDGYDFSKEWVAGIKPHVYSLIEISDLPQDVYGGNVIVNHCPGIIPTDYQDINPDAYLLGLEYAMLRPAFLTSAQQTTTNTLTGSGAFVCFGGADPLGIGYNFVNRLLLAGFNDTIYFVSPVADVTFEYKHSQQKVVMLSNLDQNQMMHYMKASKVVVVPSSTLSFEAIALRKPIFTVYYVDNQQYIYKGLTKLSLVSGAGLIQSQKDILNIIEPFNRFYKDDAKHAQMVTNQIAALDGNSKERFNAAITNLSLIA